MTGAGAEGGDAQAKSSWDNDPRYAIVTPKEGDPDPIIATALKSEPHTWIPRFRARVINQRVQACGFIALVSFGAWLASPYMQLMMNTSRGYTSFSLKDNHSTLPDLSPRWWGNEWRKGSTTWRRDEAHVPNFHVPNFAFIASATGRDMLAPPQVPVPAGGPAAGAPVAAARKGQWRALVPLSGDSPIVAVLAEAGYFVRAVEYSEVALGALTNALAARMSGARQKYLWNVKLHWADFFDSELWSIAPSGVSREQLQRREAQRADRARERLGLTAESSDQADQREKHSGSFADFAKWATDDERAVEESQEARVNSQEVQYQRPMLTDGLAGERFDLIYDRQSLTAVSPADREDFAFLLRRALKDDGVLFVEGIFRTGRVRGNKPSGPPFNLTEETLTDLFPASGGYAVRCDVGLAKDRFSLTREDKVLGRIPKDLYALPFPCVVWKPETRAKKT